jgi:hypothetical protein
MVPPSPPSKREGGKGLSRMHGNGHVRFLGGGAAAMSPCYPIAADAVVKERCSSAPADPNPHPRWHAARPVHHLVSGHARQRWSASTPRCRSLSCLPRFLVLSLIGASSEVQAFVWQMPMPRTYPDFLGRHHFQNPRVRRTRTVRISRRPRSIATHNSSFAESGSTA